MGDSAIRREGRLAAFPHATKWDADQLNPYGPNGRHGKSWNAEHKAEVWQIAFVEASAEATRRAVEESENENPG